MPASHTQARPRNLDRDPSSPVQGGRNRSTPDNLLESTSPAMPSASQDGPFSFGQTQPGPFEDDEEDDQDLDAQANDVAGNQLPPSGLKEISSLASWTVSTSKQGCGISALRSSDTSLFWQSDGPQPHYLSIHFFKLVSIVHMRIYLDWENDESYTPTKMQFWAGMGVHDLQEFAEMTFEQPKGWIDVDFGNVGPLTRDTDHLDGEEIDWDSRPVLRAFLVQVRILENHQNGKDTHLRGLQLFARDSSSAQTIHRSAAEPAIMPLRPKSRKTAAGPNVIKKASWMLDPEIR